MGTFASSPYSQIEYMQREYEAKLRDMQRYYDRRQQHMPQHSVCEVSPGVTQIVNNYTGEVQTQGKPIEATPKIDDKLKSLIAYYYHRKN